MIFIYPNTLSTFHGDRPVALKAGYIEITEQTYADLVETKLKWDNNSIVEDPTYEERKAKEEEDRKRQEATDAVKKEVAELKKKLNDSDYAIIKIAEGAATKEEYATLIAERATWRTRINELEN